MILDDDHALIKVHMGDQALDRLRVVVGFGPLAQKRDRPYRARQRVHVRMWPAANPRLQMHLGYVLDAPLFHGSHPLRIGFHEFQHAKVVGTGDGRLAVIDPIQFYELVVGQRNARIKALLAGAVVPDQANQAIEVHAFSELQDQVLRWFSRESAGKRSLLAQLIRLAQDRYRESQLLSAAWVEGVSRFVGGAIHGLP